MSNQDSFIDEVTEEVRRDKLYALYRKYGWIAVLCVVILVGGAALNEWRKATAKAAAEAAGDSLLAAIDGETPEARAAALSGLELPADAGQRAITIMLQAGAEVEAGNEARAAEILDGVAADTTLPARFRDLAALKAAMLSAGTMLPEDRITKLIPLAVPGSPYRLLALEQIALAEVEKGDRDKALETLAKITEDAAVTQDLRARVSQLIVALGGTPSAT